MDLLDLSIGQTISLSVDQTLDGGELVNQNKLWVISVIVDSIQISLEQLIVKVVAVSLVNGHIKDSAADLEQVLHDVILITFEVLQIGLNQKILLGLLQEGMELSILLLQGLVRVEEVESLDDVDEEGLSSQVLGHEKGILVLLMELSNFTSISFVL
jgi:hypothetical protein